MIHQSDDDEEPPYEQLVELELKPLGRSVTMLGYQLQPGECWVQHRVQPSDTMMHLALKYDTTVGKICRANRMHWQDLPQAHEFIWLPVPKPQEAAATAQPQSAAAAVETEAAAAVDRDSSSSAVIAALLPPHIMRESAPNVDDFASDGDPLLFTTKFMWNDCQL